MSFNNLPNEPTSKWNDADVIGDLNTPETQSLLDRPFDALVGFTTKQRRGTWRLWSTSLRQMIEIKLSRHEAKHNKDGHAMVFARARTTDEVFEYPDSNLVLPLCGRARGDIEAIMFAGYDIDDGDTLDIAIERLTALGYFAILYTTHSHGKLRSEGSGETIDKYRILFPLEEPFELAPDNPTKHELRCQEWRERLVNFAVHKLNLVIDESGCDVNRLFYTPRHKPGDKNWYSAIFTGRALRVDDMPHDQTTVRPRKRRVRQSEEGHSPTFTGKRPILSDGFDLIDWYRDWGRWFQVREFFDVLQWDFGYDSEARGEARILCVNDHAHSSADDSQACWIKDGNGESPFVVYCHHNACKEMRTLDQIVELESCAPMPDDFETLSEMLCDASFYSGADGLKLAAEPDLNRYRRWDAEEDVTETSACPEAEVAQ